MYAIRSYYGEMPVSERATVYLGGGTPSLLPIDDLKIIIDALKETKLWCEPAEVTMEMNPGTVDFAKLCQYRKMGIDRVSFGVQTLNDKDRITSYNVCYTKLLRYRSFFKVFRHKQT